MKTNDALWVVGVLSSPEKAMAAKTLEDRKDIGWMFAGVFSTKEKAIKACKTENYFITPAVLDIELPEGVTDGIGGWYPRLQNDSVINLPEDYPITYMEGIPVARDNLQIEINAVDSEGLSRVALEKIKPIVTEANCKGDENGN